MADSTTQNPGADSNAADEALIEALQEVNFQGDGWDRFAEELARYGVPIISSWISSLRISAKCADKSGDCPGPPHNIHKLSDNIHKLSDNKASEMANEIIARALNKFRDKVLRPGRRSPTGEASLNVMFITQCMLQFPNVYRQWYVERALENKRLLTDNRYDELEELEFMVAGPDGDPAGLVVIRKEIAHALEHYVKDPQVAAALPWGYVTGESDEMLDVTRNALDGVLQRHWITSRERPDDLHGGVEERDDSAMKHETEQGGTEVFRDSWQETGTAEIDRLIGCSSLGTPAAKSLRERAPAEAAQAILGRANTLGHGPFAIGIEILPFDLSGVITDHQGRIHDCRRWPLLSMDVDSVVKHMAKVAKDLAATALGLDLPHPSIGIGLQLGGPVDTRTGTVIRYENNPTDPEALQGKQPYLWEDKNLAELVERETGCRTVLQNDTAALAAVEQKFGAGQEHSTYAVILIRDGVGCNVVMENKLLPGPWELGHIIVWPDGRKCECGLVGDIDSQAGRRAIRAVIGKERGHATDPEWQHAVNLALEDGARADKALRAFEWAGEALGRGIAKLVTLLSPTCVVIYAPHELIEPTAGNTRVTDAFMSAVEKFGRQTFPPQNQCHLVTKRMQPTDGARGAALIALSRLFSVPLAPTSPNWSP